MDERLKISQSEDIAYITIYGQSKNTNYRQVFLGYPGWPSTYCSKEELKEANAQTIDHVCSFFDDQIQNVSVELRTGG